MTDDDSLYEGQRSLPCPLDIRHSAAFSLCFGGHCVGFILSPKPPALTMENQDFSHPGGTSQVMGLLVKSQDILGKVKQWLL